MIRFIFRDIKPVFMPVLIIFFASGLCFLPGYAPVLYSDDWAVFGQLYIFGGLPMIDWNNRRPLVYSGFKLLLDLFGLNLKALYFADIFVIFLCAVLVFFLARRLFPRHKFLALPAALLFLVYPVDLTRMWLIQNYTWIIYLGTLFALLLLFDFAVEGRGWKLAAALPLIALPLGAYEAQLGIVMAWCGLLAAFTRKIPFPRRLLLLLPLGIGGIFAVWRGFIQPAVFNIHDPYMEFQVNLSFFLLLLYRFIAAIPVFVNCWVQPFSNLLGISMRRMLFFWGAAVAFSAWLALWVSKEHISSAAKDGQEPAAHENPPSQAALPDFQTNRLSWHEKNQEACHLLAPFATGVVMLLAGYFPAVIAFTPSLTGVASRANMFAIFGGTLALASVIALIAILVTANRSQMRIVVLSVLIPLLLVGVTQQIWNQNEARLAWMEQKHFWRALMQALPNLKDGTTLIVVKPHKILDRPFQRLPITMEWEVTAGLQVLYNNPSLRGMLYTPGQIQVPGDARLNPDGVQSFYSNSRIPYDQVVFVYYLPGAKEVRAIDRINSEIPVEFQVQGYGPQRLILPDPPQSTPYRSLVLP